MKVRFATVLILAMVVSPLRADDAPAVQTYEDLVTAAPLPEGYTLTKQKPTGSFEFETILLVRCPEKKGSVRIAREKSELPDFAAALRDKVESFRTLKLMEFSRRGKVVDKSLPDLNKVDITQRVVSRATLQAKNKQRLFLETQTFLTKHAYMIVVLANDKAEFEKLSAWSKTIAEPGSTIGSKVNEPAVEGGPKIENVFGVFTAAPVVGSNQKSYHEIHEGGGSQGALLAKTVVVTFPGKPERVMVTRETREISDDAARRTALKGYINGSIKSFSGGGFKLIDKTLPDLDSVDLSKRFVARLTFEQAAGAPVLVELQCFFTKTGYNIVVAAHDKATLERLSTWAKTISEAPDGPGPHK